MSRLLASSRVLRGFVAPIGRWPVWARWLAGIAAGVLCVLRAVQLVVQSESVFNMADSTFYMAIASGDESQVMQPFAARQLGALVVRWLARGLHGTVARGFVVEGVVSLVVLVAIVYFLVMRTMAPRWILLGFAVVPFWGTLLQYLVIPDLWFSALLAVMLLLLAKEHLLLASLMLFPLMLSRESTSLVLVCFLVSCWSSLRWRDRVAAVLATVAGSVVVGRLATGAQPNVEHLPPAVYMVAKVPWNFLHNILGIVPWSNVYPGLCPAPAWSMALDFGPVRAVGVCGFSAHSWQLIAQAFLTSFGLLPLLVAFLWKRRDRARRGSVLLRFTLFYGVVSLTLAPLLGIWMVHLIGYAWPLFLVALPLLFGELPEIPAGRAWAALAILGVHLLACWVAYRWMWLPQLFLEMGLWVLGYFLLRFWLGKRAIAPLP